MAGVERKTVDGVGTERRDDQPAPVAWTNGGVGAGQLGEDLGGGARSAARCEREGRKQVVPVGGNEGHVALWSQANIGWCAGRRNAAEQPQGAVGRRNREGVQCVFAAGSGE